MNKSQRLLMLLHKNNVSEEGPSPDGEEVRDDMLQEIMRLRSNMNLSQLEEFDDFVQYLNHQRYAFPGTVEEVLLQMHPYQLQQVVQKFKNFMLAPEEIE